MKLKLDLHPIFSDTSAIENALKNIIDEAIERRATEIEIIPGKGSGALKKSVLRFLDRPEIKARYHRLEKDSDNWGRLFVHFRHEREPDSKPSSTRTAIPTESTPCACCNGDIKWPQPDLDEPDHDVRAECPWCGSPNLITYRRNRRGSIHSRSQLDYS